jgi:hypothetical protein
MARVLNLKARCIQPQWGWMQRWLILPWPAQLKQISPTNGLGSNGRGLCHLQRRSTEVCRSAGRLDGVAGLNVLECARASSQVCRTSVCVCIWCGAALAVMLLCIMVLSGHLVVLV